MDEVSAVDRSRYFPVPDVLFTGSCTLDRESIKDYVRSMCQTAARELAESEPRTFMLLRLADVAYFNMERPKIIWQEIWEIISEFLIEVASAEDGQDEVLQGTVNVLWQIARKFIARPETAAFHLQQHFMRPFFEIFIAQPSVIIREFIVTCCACLVNDFSNTLHSGWYVVFQILSQASDDFRPKGYRLLSTIIEKHFHALSTSQILHLISVGMAFVVKGKEEKLSCKCVLFFMKIAKQLKAGDDQLELWDCVYASLEKCITHPLVEVKKKAILTGIAMAKESDMPPQFRKIVFTETLPRFLDMLTDPSLAEFVGEWKRKVTQWTATKC
jgi:Sec7-like guanine-nucleotide exchange factor